MERIPFIANSERRMNSLARLRGFLLSKPFMLICVLLGCVTTLTGIEFYAVLGFVALILFILVVSDELIATTLPFLVLCCFAVKCYDSFSTYIKVIWLAPLCVAAFVLHFVLYRKPFKVGSSIWSLIAVTVAVVVGGIGEITAKDYFSLTSIYYILGLGVGMIIVYIIAYSYFNDTDKTDVRRKFAYIMYLTGIFACLIVLLHYAQNFGKVMETRSILEPQWRNNISTIIMLTMPFGFYLSIRQPHCFAAALLSMPCLMLTSSRGGLLFGAAEFVLCCIYILYTDKKHRARNLVVFTVCGCALILASGDIIAFISKTLARFETINDEPRAALIQRAVEDFKSNPLFGRGIGYMGNRDIHPSKKFAACWYHSSPFQIIGSFGIVGIAGFGYQFFRRNQIFWSKITYYTLAVYISYLGILMMSLVNPGEFCPVPYELIVVVMFALIEHNCPKSKERILFGGKEKSARRMYDSEDEAVHIGVHEAKSEEEE